MTAIEIMMEEHENICRMLKVIRKECMGILKGDDINYEHFNMIIGFIRNAITRPTITGVSAETSVEISFKIVLNLNTATTKSTFIAITITA